MWPRSRTAAACHSRESGNPGVVELTASVSPRADVASPVADNPDSRVVSHWIPAFAGMTFVV